MPSSNPIDHHSALRRIDLNLLLILDSLMTTRSATATAKMLHKTQPGVSRDLAKLRHIFDDPLFVLTKGRLEPTEHALNLHATVRLGLQQLDQALIGKQTFQPSRIQDVINIGVGAHFELLLAPALIDAVARMAPNLILRFHSVHGDFDPADLDREVHDVSIGLFEDIPQRFTSTRLFSDERCVVMGRGHPLASRRRIRTEDLSNGDWFAFSQMHRHRTDLGRAMKGFRQQIPFRAYLSGFGISPYLLIGNRYATTMPSFAATLHEQHFDLLSKPAPAPLRSLTFRMVWPRRLDAAPAHQWLREKITDVVAEFVRAGVLKP
jgi:DNA-binding transcriptional LysR family regulator